jgi:hypothetical protein
VGKLVLGLVVFLFACRAMCQPLMTLPHENGKALSAELGILPDRGYSIEEFCRDTTIRFQQYPDSITVGNIYWLKITVQNPHWSHEDYVLRVSPQLKNVLYYFDPDLQKWHDSRTDALNNTGSRLVGRHPVSIAGHRPTTIFVKIDLTGFGHAGQQLKLTVSFQPEKAATEHEQNIRTAWICCVVVLLIFMINYVYLYFTFGDRTVLYYLLTQLGGIIYITGYRWMFVPVLPIRVFNIDVHEIITYYDLNKIIIHLAVVLTLSGFTGITRMFLNTKNTLPRLDRILRTSNNFYAILIICIMIINLTGYSMEHYTLPFANVFCIIIIMLILLTGTEAYRRKLPYARPFMLANGIPLLFMLAIPLSHLVISLTNEENLWIPELVVLTQTLALSIALVARTKAVQGALSAAEIDNQKLEFSLREADYLVQVNQLEIAKVNADINAEKIKNELLKERLETNQRELATSTLHMVQKNELLNYLKSQMQLLSRPNPGTAQGMRAMSSLIDKSTDLDTDWQKFKMHFDQIHPDFFEELKTNHPQLTTKETRLYAYLHMKLSHKEIASLLNIDPASVRRSKTRLFKKMAIPETEQTDHTR